MSERVASESAPGEVSVAEYCVGQLTTETVLNLK